MKPEESKSPARSDGQDHPDDCSEDDDAGEDPRLLEAVKGYLAALESGGRPSRREWLTRHPEIAAKLSVYLDGLAFVHSAAGRLAGDDGKQGSQADQAMEADIAIGRPLGDFRLIREIGRGGMGIVYEAVQLSLGRRVAVKVLPLAGSLDSRQLERFKNEAQAAAQLHHTNIVPVYAVGCERSVHFYAMQLIEGLSLADVIRDLRRVAGKLQPPGEEAPEPAPRNILNSPPFPHSSPFPPSSPFSFSADPPEAGTRLAGATEAGARAITPEALTTLHVQKGSAFFRSVAMLALQAAEALDYAHRLGVVHRDIKPANLLLDMRGTLWVTDFGLARMYADNSLTQPGDLIGTLRYMSPEQASGRAVVLDERTDIYSLGTTLYELVTLERAVTGLSREQMLHQIDAVDAAPARSINKAVPQELETIVVKATAKDPADRYASARAMADDLQRFLNDQPILARPPSLRDKAVKWARRHRSLTFSAVAILLLAAAGLLTSTLLIAREQAKTRAAYLLERDRAAEAMRQRGRAEKSFGQARAGVDFFARVAAEELADNPQMSDVRKELLEAALDYYQEFIEDHQDDPAIGEQLAEAQSHVSAILVELSAFEDFDRVMSRVRLLAEPSVREALALSADQSAKVQAFDSDFSSKFFRGQFPGGDSNSHRPSPPDSAKQAGEGHGGHDGRDLHEPRDAHDSRDPHDAPDSRDPHDMTPEQRRATFAALAGEVDAALAALLTPRQSERLKEISRQVRGPAAFDDPDVARALSLTHPQRDSLRRAQADYRKAQRELYRHGGPWGPPDDATNTDEQATKLREDAVRQIISQFIPAQVLAWADLTGERFAGKLSTNRPPWSGAPHHPFGHDHDHPSGPPPGEHPNTPASKGPDDPEGD
jgi:serine/threonine protein kinase